MAEAAPTFVTQAVRGFGRNVAAAFSRANRWRGAAVRRVQGSLDAVRQWEGEHAWALIVALAVLLWLGLIIWFIADAAHGAVHGNALQAGVGGVIVGAVLGFIASAILAGVLFLALLLLNFVFRAVASIVLFLPLVLGVPLYALGQSIIVVAQLLLLVPLFLLFLATRLVQLWRRIFFTCPSRTCSYRGFPAFLCPKCGAPNSRLWPNMHGPFHHPCVNCHRRLPALGFLGRNALVAVCAECGIPLTGRHIGERLVAVVGGPGSGKTNFLAMSLHELTNHGGRANPHAEIVEDAQAREFAEEWALLSEGLPVAKTTEVARARLLHMNLGGSECKLYLYDAPGEEFQDASSMQRQPYFRFLEGFILLVDPLSFATVRAQSDAPPKRVSSFDAVVASTLEWAAAAKGVSGQTRLPLRAAVVISKADLPAVIDSTGDLRHGPISGPRCKQSIINWGGGNGIRLLELRCQSVEYFACSALGREAGTNTRQPFRSFGVLPPLEWVLTGARTTGTATSSSAEQTAASTGSAGRRTS